MVGAVWATKATGSKGGTQGKGSKGWAERRRDEGNRGRGANLDMHWNPLKWYVLRKAGGVFTAAARATTRLAGFGHAFSAKNAFQPENNKIFTDAAPKPRGRRIYIYLYVDMCIYIYTHQLRGAYTGEFSHRLLEILRSFGLLREPGAADQVELVDVLGGGRPLPH